MLQDDRLIGYGVIRPCQLGYKIGPLFPENEHIANSIFINLQSSIPIGETFYLDIPEINPLAKALVQKYNMTKVFETARMYNPKFPHLPTNNRYSVTSFELG
jgi:Acetyltransferase (GNAT) domain